MTSFVRTDAQTANIHHAGIERVQRAAENLGTYSHLTAAFAKLRQAAQSFAAARRRAKEEDRHYNRALREARMIADLSRAMNGLAVENIRRYD